MLITMFAIWFIVMVILVYFYHRKFRDLGTYKYAGFPKDECYILAVFWPVFLIYISILTAFGFVCGIADFSLMALDYTVDGIIAVFRPRKQ